MDNTIGAQRKGGKEPNGKLRKVLILLMIFMVALAAATQYFAYEFNYSEGLGPNWNKLYWPWGILSWYKYRLRYESEYTGALGLGMVVVCVGMVAFLVVERIRKNTAKANAFLHGSARWAEEEDIIAMSLLPRKRTLFQKLTFHSAPPQDGVFVGGWEDKRGKLHFLRHNGPEHVLCFAPTRSGKGVGLVNPTLLSWRHSSVITDLKGELWELTAGWRKKYADNYCIRFEPASRDSAHWNVFDSIRFGTVAEEGDVQNIATMIVDPDGKGLEDHWSRTSQALLVGLIIHCYYKSKVDSNVIASLPGVDSLISDPARPVTELWEEMKTFPHCDGKPHMTVAKTGQDMLDRPENEGGSILSTVKSHLSLYRDGVVAANVNDSDFLIPDLMNLEKPCSLYIITKPTDKTRLKPLIRMLVNMIIRLLADKLEFEKGRAKGCYKHRLLLMLDEFPSLGKLEVMQESLAFIAGYGLKAYLIIQDLSQLHAAYGKDESITSNCHVQNAYPPNRLETAQHLSNLTGQTTIVKEQVTTSGGRSALMMNNVSKTMQEVQRPLLTPDEAMRLEGPLKDSNGNIVKPGAMVVYTAGFPAIYGRQLLYFQIPQFQKRAEVPAPPVTDKPSRHKTANIRVDIRVGET